MLLPWPERGAVAVQAPGTGPGYWAGAPCAVAGDGEILRKRRIAEPELDGPKPAFEELFGFIGRGFFSSGFFRRRPGAFFCRCSRIARKMMPACARTFVSNRRCGLR